jgi:hypothetical protein
VNKCARRPYFLFLILNHLDKEKHLSVLIRNNRSTRATKISVDLGGTSLPPLKPYLFYFF